MSIRARPADAANERRRGRVTVIASKQVEEHIGDVLWTTGKIVLRTRHLFTMQDDAVQHNTIQSLWKETFSNNTKKCLGHNLAKIKRWKRKKIIKSWLTFSMTCAWPTRHSKLDTPTESASSHTRYRVLIKWIKINNNNNNNNDNMILQGDNGRLSRIRSWNEVSCSRASQQWQPFARQRETKPRPHFFQH